MSHSAFIARWIPTNRATIARDIITHTAVDHGDSPGELDSLFLIAEEMGAIVGVGGSEVEIIVICLVLTYPGSQGLGEVLWELVLGQFLAMPP